MTNDKAFLCKRLLLSLPQWFGKPDGIQSYAELASSQHMLGCYSKQDLIGFIVYGEVSTDCTELIVMAIEPSLHRLGFGKALIDAVVRRCQRDGKRLLLVKTLGSSIEDAAYAATRKFYESNDFLTVGEFDGIWPGNPCSLMVRIL